MWCHKVISKLCGATKLCLNYVVLQSWTNKIVFLTITWLGTRLCLDTSAIRIQIHWIAKILASWIRIRKKSNQQLQKKTFLLSKTLIWTAEKISITISKRRRKKLDHSVFCWKFQQILKKCSWSRSIFFQCWSRIRIWIRIKIKWVLRFSFENS